MDKKNRGILCAILAAAFYALSAPFSKILLDYIPETLTAGFLYLGAGICMLLIAPLRKKKNEPAEEKHLTRKELPYTVAMILLDIAAPICLLTGLGSTTAESASLLNNFEIVATAVIALSVFRERISPRLWGGILFITLSCAVLSADNVSELHFSGGSLFILLAAVLWGFENNCTRKISSKDPLEIVLLKGIFSGLGSLIVAFLAGDAFPGVSHLLLALLLGFVSYGLSIFFYVRAQKYIGAASTSAYYSVSPFIGALLSFVFFDEALSKTYPIALVVMLIGAAFAVMDTLQIHPFHKKSGVEQS